MLVMARIIYLLVVFYVEQSTTLFFCLALIHRAYAFGFSGEGRDCILLSARGTTRILLSSFCSSEPVTLLWELG